MSSGCRHGPSRSMMLVMVTSPIASFFIPSHPMRRRAAWLPMRGRSVRGPCEKLLKQPELREVCLGTGVEFDAANPHITPPKLEGAPWRVTWPAIGCGRKRARCSRAPSGCIGDLQAARRRRPPVAWEPPVDVLETEREVLVLVALARRRRRPASRRSIEDGDLVIAGTRGCPPRIAHRDHPPARTAARPLRAARAAAAAAATAACAAPWPTAAW